MGREPNRSGRRIVTLAVALAAALVASLVAFSGPASAADWTVTLKLTKTDAKQIKLRAEAGRALAGSGLVLAIWDTTTGTQLTSCTTSCEGGNAVAVLTVPTASTTELSSVAHSYVATISDPAVDGTVTPAAYPPAGAVVTSDPVTADPWAVQFTSNVLSSKQVQFTAWTNYSLPGSGYTLAVFDQTTGALLKSCSGSQCDGSPIIGNYYTRVTTVPKATTSELSAVPHQYVAILAGITDSLPGDNVAATSATLTQSAYRVAVSVAQLGTQQIQVTAATNWSLQDSGYSLAIFDKTTGVQVASCREIACAGSGSIGYYYLRTGVFTPRGSTTEESSQAHEYVAVVGQDVKTLPGDNVAATAVTTAKPWQAYLTVAGDSKSYTLTATSSYTLDRSGYTLAIYDQTTGQRLGVCGGKYTPCSGNGTVSGYWLRVGGRTTGFSDSYVAVVSDDSATLPADNIASTSAPVTPTS